MMPDFKPDLWAHARRDEAPTVPGGEDTDQSEHVLIQAARALVRRCAVDRKHDNLYLGGMSQDRRVCSIDRDTPTEWTDSHGVTVDLDLTITFHELVETALMDAHQLRYQLAHQIALHAEQELVLAIGADWDEYSEFLAELAEACLEKQEPDTMPGLDTKPYDDEGDTEALERMRAADPEHPMSGVASSPVDVEPPKRRRRRKGFRT
jgi:hypothetical protein